MIAVSVNNFDKKIDKIEFFFLVLQGVGTSPARSLTSRSGLRVPLLAPDPAPS